MITALFSVMLLASDAAAEAAPAPAAPAATSAEATEAPKAERKICKSEQVSGSMRAKRVCLTASQWRARTGRDDGEEISNR